MIYLYYANENYILSYPILLDHESTNVQLVFWIESEEWVGGAKTGMREDLAHKTDCGRHCGTAQSIVEELDISPSGKNPDSLVKLVLMGDFPREFPCIKF